MKKIIDLFFQLLRNIALSYYFEKTTILDGVASYKLKREIKVPFIYAFCFLSNRGLKNIAMTQPQILYLAEKMDEQFKKEENEALIFSENDGPCIVKLYWKEDSWNISASKLSPDWQPERGFLTSVVE